MKRPAGVVVSAVVLILGSLFELLMAACVAFAGVIAHRPLSHVATAGAPPAPVLAPWMPTLFYGIAAFMVLLSVWGILTAIGVLRLRPWARYSILILGGALAFFGLVSAASMVLLVFVPVPMPPPADPAQAQSLHLAIRGIFAGIAFFYLLVAAIGVWWLVYFNRKATRAAFAGAQPEEAFLATRPFLITLLAIFNVVGAAGCLIMTLVPIPAAFFGAILHGWPKAVLYFAIAGVEVAIAIGLWRLREWGRRLAIGFMGFGFAQCLFNLLNPSLLVQYGQEFSRTLVPVQPQMTRYSSAMVSFYSILSILFIGAILVVLFKYRRAFSPPPSTAL